MTRTTIPSVVERFHAYKAENLAWGSLHIVLDDRNVEDGHVVFCREFAREHDDTEGAALADVLLSMSEQQRLRLPDAVARFDPYHA